MTGEIHFLEEHNVRANPRHEIGVCIEGRQSNIDCSKRRFDGIKIHSSLGRQRQRNSRGNRTSPSTVPASLDSGCTRSESRAGKFLFCSNLAKKSQWHQNPLPPFTLSPPLPRSSTITSRRNPLPPFTLLPPLPRSSTMSRRKPLPPLTLLPPFPRFSTISRRKPLPPLTLLPPFPRSTSPGIHQRLVRRFRQ